MKKTIAITLLSLTSLSILSCAKVSSKEDLKDAQLCLNTAPASAARDCVAKIASDTSPAANKLRCAAIFISEGVTATTFTDALDKIKNNGTCTGGCSSTVSAISTLNFHSGANLSTDNIARDKNIATSVEAFTYCTQSGTKIYGDISSLFRIGTEAAMIAYPLTGGAEPTEDQIKTAVGSMDAATVGTIVQTTYASSCSNRNADESENTKKYCDELASALAGGADVTSIGNCFKAKLQDPTHICP